MYSWKTIRTWCTILLLVPLIHLSYLLSREMIAVLDSSPTAWNVEVEAYTRNDVLDQLPGDPVVVVGGRNVKLWQDLGDILAPEQVLMRGLGDATVNDISYHYERLIGFYRPRTLVLLPGNSEFHIRDNKSATELVSAIKALADLDARHHVTQRFYVFSPLKTLLHTGDYEKINTTVLELQSWAETDPRVSILDANALLAGPDERPRADFFRSDGLHLNEHGYLRLSLLLRAKLEQDGLHTRIDPEAT